MAKLISETLVISVSQMVRGSVDDENKTEQMLSNELLDQLESILAELLAANGHAGVLVETTRKY